MLIFLKSTGKTLLYLTTLLCTAAIHAQPAFSDPVQQAYIKASNTDSFDAFGHVVAISADGNTLAVGAVKEDSNATSINPNSNPAALTGQYDNHATDAGAVYIFTRSGTSWSQQAYLKADNAEAQDFFGASIALSDDGNTLAIGAPGEDANPQALGGSSNNGMPSAGAVYLFTRSGSDWSQQAYLKASNAGMGDSFGAAVSLSSDGNTLAVGAAGEDSNATGVNPASFVLTQTGQYNNAAINAGAAYVFSRTGTSWQQHSYIKAINTGADDAFAYSLALSGDGRTLAVGAAKEDSNATGINVLGNSIQQTGQHNNDTVDSGAAYVFYLIAGHWYHQSYLKASNTGMYDFFATAIALSDDGSTLAIGAVGEHSQSTGVNPASHPTTQTGQYNNNADSAGAAYVFSRQTNWSQTAYIKASNTDKYDLFAHALTLSGDGVYLVVGAKLESSNANGVDGAQHNNTAAKSGAAYVYSRDQQHMWTQQHYLKSLNAGSNDQFAASLALSRQGNALAVGAVYESSASTGINSTPNEAASAAGAAYVFTPNAYTVGGTLSGLAAGESVTLQNNGGDDVTLTNDGQFTFATPVASGSPYAVTITTKPASKTCHVNHANGLIASSSITNIAVHCWLPGRIFSDSFE